MDGDEASDDDFSAIELPSIIDQLKRLLEQYSDGQIIKELIQNAEDGGATEVKFLYTNDNHEEIEYSKRAWKESPIKIAMQSPAICVYNNGMFTDKDWKGIAAIQCSEKENEPLKVGRFGLGFKSVFHLTDFPLIISGDKVMVMNPLTNVTQVVHRKKLSKVDSESKSAMLNLIGNKFGFSESCFKDEYRGTLFWFPLRTEASALSRDTYTFEKIQDIFHGFKDLAPSILLFLKKIESIEVFEESETDQIYQVEIATEKQDLQLIRKQRDEFLNRVEELNGKLANEYIFHQMRLTIICEGKKWLSEKRKKKEWIVVNHYHGGDVSCELQGLINDTEWSYSPYVSVAGCLSNSSEDFKGHIYCFLPLPLERTSPTGLPVHINGFFALSQDRHHIKWMSSEEENKTSHSDNSVEWNRILATEILPLVYTEMLTNLTKDCIEKHIIYKLLPKPDLITQNWKCVIEPLFAQLYMKNIIFTKNSGGKWIKPEKAIVLVEDDYEEDILKVIEDVYLLMKENIACLSQNFVDSLKQHGNIEVSDPSILHSCLLRQEDIFKIMEKNQKMKLMEYFVSRDVEKLENLELLPLANGEFQTFKESNSEVNVFCCKAERLKLFPGMETRFLHKDLPQHISDQLIDEFQVKRLMPEDIPGLLEECIEINRFRETEVTPAITSWLDNVWKYIHKHDGTFQLSSISHLHLLPFQENQKSKLIRVDSVSILSTKENMDTLHPKLSIALEKLGVKIIKSLSNTISASLEGRFVQYPTTDGIFNCLTKIIGSRELIEKFNQEASFQERNQLLNKILDMSCDQIQEISKLIQQLEIFELMNSDQYTCLNVTNQMYYKGNHPELPIPYKHTVIKCTSKSVMEVGKVCGCAFLEYEQVIEKTLESLNTYTESEQQEFMKFFLEHLSDFEKNVRMINLAGDICCIKNRVGEMVKPKDLLDPRSSLLDDMFPPCKFPSKDYDVKKLKKLGLRFEEDLTGKDVLNVADTVIDDGTDYKKIDQKGKALCKWIDKYSNLLDKTTTDKLTSKTICPIMMKRPKGYPKRLPFKGEDFVFGFKKPSEVYNCTDADLVGGVAVLSSENIPQCFKTSIRPVQLEVFDQLKLVTSQFSPADKIEFLPVLNNIYENIKHSKLQIPDEMLNQKIIWTGSTFQKACYVYITKKKDDLRLQPYRYPLPTEMEKFHSMFEKFGCVERQNDQMLLDTLIDIKTKHDTFQTIDESEVSQDTSLVLQIVNTLANSPEDFSQSILLPVHTDSSKLLLKLASECTVCNESWLKDLSNKDDDEDEDDDDEIFYVHKKISSYTADKFNVPPLTDRVLCDADKFDMNFGQNEPLTTRLKNLLKDYTDGFTVPKEIIQNADDAGACVVKFLYDERYMPEAMTFLFNEGMEPVQGPAFWAYNDAKFTDTDYGNITKLAGATKKDDKMKIGRFGLGFNSVYNLTDTPSFISGDTYVIFDPHTTHLQKSGLKIKLNYPKNRKMRQKMKGQFYPFDGIFQCNVLTKESIDFDGTLFRFPLRNQSEAAKSLIKDFSYSKNEMKEFIQKIAEGCGNLLLFTQNVKKIELYHLHKEGKPSDVKLLLEVSKSSNVKNASALKILTSHNSQYGEEIPAQLSEKIQITVSVKQASNEQDYFKLHHFEETFTYLISWSFGKDKVINAAKRKEFNGLLPIAATAVLMNNQNKSMESFGFYKKSHLYCFLPLPIPTSLPAHVNGSFAVQSSRRDLVWKNEDDIDVPEDEWNMCLLEDAGCQAYLLMMTTMARDLPEEIYNTLWPDLSKCTTRHDKVLSKQIYKTICEGDYKVFKSNDETVSIGDAIFLDPAFKDQDVIGEIAFKTLCHFTKTKMKDLNSMFGDGIAVVNMPSEVWKQFKEAGFEEAIRRRIVTVETFYRLLFFPTLLDKYWSSDEIDELLLYSLKLENGRIKTLIVNSDCIPTKPNHKRLKPCSLIHPNGEIADLFDESEECFPDDTKLKTGNFRDFDVMNILLTLGMKKDDLPWEQMPERITVAIDSHDSILIKTRYEHFITYMSSRKENYQKKFEFCPEEIRLTLSQLPFLPVKKLTWKFPQYTDGDDMIFVAAHEAYLPELQHFVGCSSPIVDTTTRSYTIINDGSVLKWLGVKHSEPQIPLELILRNILIMSESYIQSPFKDLDLKKSFEAIYKHLNDRIDKSDGTPEHTSIKELISLELKGKAVILHKETLTTPEVLVLEPGINIEPYISSTPYGNFYGKFFTLIGVLPKLTATKILDILIQIGKEKCDQLLQDEEISTIGDLCRIFIKLPKEEQCSPHVSEKMKRVKLPDSEGKLTSTSLLCFDDSVVVYNQNIKDIKHLNPTFDRKIAEVFGVKSKRGHTFDAISCPLFSEFGQHEELTNRIKRILEGYPCDESILKEMLQNADDAGATEVIFITDFRSLPCDSLPDPKLTEVQGPALCIYNNSFFTEDDLKGIQELGTGSKKDEVLKTGQYGVGFNVVYHVTDVPSFWTKGGDVGETVCVFDPHCKYLSMANSLNPGLKIEAAGLRDLFPDFNEGYLPEFTKNFDQGTVFRLPLRNGKMAPESKISDEVMTRDHIDEIFEILKKQIFSSMLFLENITSVKFGTVKENGNVEILYDVKSSMNKQNQKEQKSFNNHLLDLNSRIKTKQEDAFHLPKEVAIDVHIEDNLKQKEDYLIVKHAGFKTKLPGKLTEALKTGKLIKLPRGGVALNLKKETCGIAYCTLPLPIKTGLPFHVNGQFALDHESRRNIWNDENSVAGLWNSELRSQIIVPAYLRLLEEFKLFPLSVRQTKLSKYTLKTEIEKFEGLLPKSSSADGNFWKDCVLEIYSAIGSEKRPFFPVLKEKTLSWYDIEWVAVQTDENFDGCFDTLYSYYKDDTVTNKDATAYRSSALSTLNLPTTYSTSSSGQKPPKDVTLKKVLIKLGMKVLETSEWIFEEFKLAKVKVQSVNPENVLKFVKSYQSQVKNKCQLNIPGPIQTTPFGCLKNFKLVLKFILHYIKEETVSDLKGSPLLLRQNGILDIFGESYIIVSSFCGIFEEFSQQFLNFECVHFMERFVGSFPLFIKWSLESFYDMFRKSESYKLYTNGEIYPWIKDHIPLHWICKVWKFISQHLTSTPGDSTVQLIPGSQQYELLSSLTILPVCKGDNEFFLYPLSKAHYIFDARVGTRSTTNDRMKDALLKLQIPCLVYPEYTMPEYKTAQQTVASVDDPSSIVKLLTSNLSTSICDCSKIALDILKYINERIDDIKTSAVNMRQLKLFETHENSLTDLCTGQEYICLVEDYTRPVPKEGIKHWAQSSNICILKYYRDTQKLFDVLKIKSVKSEELYYHYILPNFHYFQAVHHKAHLTYVRDLLDKVPRESKELICSALKYVKFLLHSDGDLHRACDFYDKSNAVFNVMLTGEHFPPHPYSDDAWYVFLISAGLISSVTTNMFIKFARTVEGHAENRIDEDVLKKSDVLLQHLRHIDADIIHKENILPQIKHIKFVKRVTLCNKEHHIMIHQQYNGNSISLVSFSGSFLKKDIDFIWTVGNMIEEWIVPYERKTPKGKLNFNELLGISTHISLDLFEANMKNVCMSLDNEQIIKQVGVHRIQDLFGKFYGYLQKNSGAGSKNYSTIFLPDEKKLVKAWRVIIKPEKSQLINGRIFEAPLIYYTYFDVFKTLGVKSDGEPSLYLSVLKEIYGETFRNELHPNEFRIVQQCLENLNKLWTSSKVKDESTESILYLPSVDKKMEPSTNLILIDNNLIHKRSAKIELNYFIGFEKLKIGLTDQLTSVKTWPKQFRMKRLSEIVSEKMIGDNSDGSGRLVEDIHRRLCHPEMIRSLVRIMRHLQHKNQKKIDNEDAVLKKVKQIKDIQVISVENLTTQLYYNDKVIEGSEFTVKLFQDKSSLGSRILYIDSKIPADLVSLVSRLSMILDKIMHENISVFFAPLWTMSKSSCSEISSWLDEQGIEQSVYECKLDYDIFPEPGTFIPQNKHWLLDNSFVCFHVDEYVGYEVYDPDINDESDDIEDTVKSPVPVYIYAVVKEILKEESETEFARYRIDIGEDENIDVDSTKIYKFHRNLSSGSREMVLRKDSQQGGASESAIPDDKKSILKEIRQLLNKAWKLPEADRKRVIKRLLLKWHPDKNLDKKELATEITQKIFNYIEQLKEGRSLEDDDDEDYTDGASSQRNYYSSGSYRHFYENMRSRGRSYAEYSDRQRSSRSYYNDSSFHFNSGPIPRPDEATRWFRQARFDAEAAEESQNQRSDNYNWICYMCQQAAEKALKAVWYTIDSNKVSQQHDLNEVACGLSQYPELVSLAAKLQSCIGIHTRMRYPDTLHYPKVPKDVYDCSQSFRACELTRQIVNLVSDIV